MIWLLSLKDTVWLFWRVWRLSRRKGIPFEPLLDAHLQALDSYRDAIEEAVATLAPADPEGDTACLVGCRPAVGLHRLDCPNLSDAAKRDFEASRAADPEGETA